MTKSTREKKLVVKPTEVDLKGSDVLGSSEEVKKKTIMTKNNSSCNDCELSLSLPQYVTKKLKIFCVYHKEDF